MLAEEHLRAGRLEQSLEALQDAVRREPASAKLRIFLFQLLAVLGHWERAVKQLQVAAGLDPLTEPMAQTYRELIRCELLRAEVFSGRRTPLIFGEPEAWMAPLVEALRLSADCAPCAGTASGAGAGVASESGTTEDRAAQAQALREEALALAPASAGQLEGAPFDWIADADSRLGPMLEAVVNGHYYWVPFHRLREVRIEAPSDLRDLVWLPAQLTFPHDGEVVAFIPARYAGSELHEDGMVRLGRKTEWQPIGQDAYRGLGQRILVTDQAELPLAEVRLMALEQKAPEPGGSSESTGASEPDGHTVAATDG